MPSHPNSGMPLAGKTALLVCSAIKVDALTDGLRSMGAHIRPFCTIETRPVRNSGPLDHSIQNIEDYTWVIFTSAHAVLFFANRLAELGVPPERLDCLQICAVGPATARTAAERGFRISLVPDDFVAEGVIEALAKRMGSLEALRGKRILLPRAQKARDVIPSRLSAAGAAVDIAVCYETVEAQSDPILVADLRSHPPDLIVFTSSATVTSFVSIIGQPDSRSMLARATVAALGPITAQTLSASGKTPEILPLENTIPALLSAIRKHFQGE